ncbi:MAG: alpha/beta hydrolase [Nitrososphaeraceae archaeon]|nr:alpha/beta hydrolase [Nitrososphaeraceae archaeon]
MNPHNFSKLDYDTRIFIESLQKNPIPPCKTLSLQQVRNVFSNFQKDVQIKKTKFPVKIERYFVPDDINEYNDKISIHIYRPIVSGADKDLPVIIYCHGGGWTIGDIDIYDRLVRELVNGTSAAVVFVDYSLSPEKKYPIALEQIYTTAKWISENGNQIGLNSSRLAVFGDSAGGNLAAALTLLAKERGGPNIIFQVLFSPVTDVNFETSSYIEYQDGYFLTREDMKWFWNNYLPKNVDPKEPTVSPLQASIDQLKGLPPALIVSAENDVLRDECEAYAKKLMEAKVQTTAIRYIGTIHDFIALNALADSQISRVAIDQATNILKQYFEIK